MKANYHEVFNLKEKCLSMKLVKSETNRFYFQCPICGNKMEKKIENSFYKSGKYECVECRWKKT